MRVSDFVEAFHAEALFGYSVVGVELGYVCL